METRQKVEKLYKQHALICNLIFFFSSFGCRCDLQKANRAICIHIASPAIRHFRAVVFIVVCGRPSLVLRLQSPPPPLH
ncbi:hypothetical protein V9T40_010581 [Parthenolecanium corni]|uniref:Uncharacterized protein n=1 Tax=Parthenolecanium corni TaxID=536013 RepID=A0AAN9T4F5_9HEMI